MICSSAARCHQTSSYGPPSSGWSAHLITSQLPPAVTLPFWVQQVSHPAILLYIIISIQPFGRFWQEPEPSQPTGMALAGCILGKFLGVVCHCFPLPLDVPTFAARCLHVPNNASTPCSEKWNCGRAVDWYVVSSDMPIHNILLTAPRLSISQKALENLTLPSFMMHGHMNVTDKAFFWQLIVVCIYITVAHSQNHRVLGCLRQM
jgi:hypothetical protein